MQSSINLVNLDGSRIIKHFICIFRNNVKELIVTCCIECLFTFKQCY